MSCKASETNFLLYIKNLLLCLLCALVLIGTTITLMRFAVQSESVRNVLHISDDSAQKVITLTSKPFQKGD